MRKLRILVLMHESLVPPDSIEGVSDDEMLDWKSEFDVVATLKAMGHEVQPLGVSDDTGPIRRAILSWKPHICFNLLEEFHGVGTYDQHIASYLELMRQPYTGCNPRGLMLARDKALSKKLLSYHRIRTPQFVDFPLNRKVRPPANAQYPLIVKSAIEDASLGITEASVVYNAQDLKQRVACIHDELKTDALAEQFIGGREFYVGVIGNIQLKTLPIWELQFTNAPAGFLGVATARVKWDSAHQKQLGVQTNAATDLPPATRRAILKLCKRVYRALSLSGYARMDLRLGADGKPYILEANPNPNISYGEDFAESAEAAGLSYEELLQRILNLGLRHRAPWRG